MALRGKRIFFMLDGASDSQVGAIRQICDYMRVKEDSKLGFYQRIYDQLTADNPTSFGVFDVLVAPYSAESNAVDQFLERSAIEMYIRRDYMEIVPYLTGLSFTYRHDQRNPLGKHYIVERVEELTTGAEATLWGAKIIAVSIERNSL